MFSVVIALYNKVSDIQKALESVNNQTFCDFEVIIIDDGSTDGSDKVVSGFKHNNQNSIITLITQKNSGVSVARNKGVEKAKFPFIAFLDADDWWHPDYLLNMKRLIDQYPEAGIYGSSYFKVKNNREVPAKIGVDNDFRDGLINYFQVYAKTLWMPLWTGATIIKKSVFEEFRGFKPNLKLGEDFDLWVRVALKYPVAFCNKSLAYYNQDVDDTSRGVGRFRLYDKNEYFAFNLSYLEVFENTNSQLKFLLDNLRVVSLLRYRLEEQYKEEVDQIIKGVDFKKLPLSQFLNFHLPVPVVKMFYNSRVVLSNAKQFFIK